LLGSNRKEERGRTGTARLGGDREAASAAVKLVGCGLVAADAG